MKHLLALEDLNGTEITALIALAEELKRNRRDPGCRVLEGQVWGLIFCKSSTRTRVSFEVGIRELGGEVMFLSERQMQLGRGEPIRDTARVLGRLLDGAVIRTYAQGDIVEFAELGGIPTINALTDAEHPCQILADLLTMREKIGGWEGKRVCFLGDIDCNVAWSWIWAAERLGFELVLSGPGEFAPKPESLARLASGKVTVEPDAQRAVAGCHVLYTDVWVSMGKEKESASRIEVMRPYQVNAELLALADPGAIVMHCLPAYREKEITEEVLEAHADTIFQEAENRLHAQKAVLYTIAKS
jgi:ornithine carbamoyltransferase